MFGTSNSQNTFSPSTPNTLLDTSIQSLIVPASGLNDPLQAQLRPASANPPSIEHATSGVFTVGATGNVNFDYLFDGGGYEGEVAIFDLDGMDRYAHAGVEFFAREAALRALANTDLGHVVISDQTEGARFSGSLPYEGDFNSGTYTGAKTFSMRPGEHFGIMLVPNGKVEDILYNRNWEINQLPLFSVSLANPMQAMQFTKLVDTHPDVLNLVDGNTFSFEDLRLDGYSDRDFNDMIFQVRGATGDASLIDKVIDPQHDWRNSDVGKKLMSYANVDSKGLTARYYDNDNFTGYRGRRTDGSVDFSWKDGAPSVMTSPDTFSIHWTGQVEAQYSEDYTFYTRSDEKVRLWINGQLMVDHWTNHTLTEDSGKITLQAGKKYDIKLEYAEETGDASMQLLWSSASQLKEIIPQNFLYTDPTALPLDPKNGLEYRPNEVHIKVQPTATEKQIQTLAQMYGATSVERLVPFNPAVPSKLDQWRVLHFAPQVNIPHVRDLISQNSGVQLANLDYTIEFDAIPSDVSYTNGDLWGLNKIDAPAAWSKVKPGSPDVIVGVLDTGVDYTHPDLAANIVPGYDFGDNDADPMDDSVQNYNGHTVRGHGTHVAGTIGAVANNSLVDASGQPLSQNVVGVAQNVKVMPLKVVGSNGQGFFANAAQAIHFAIANGARVLNASFGGPRPNGFAEFFGYDDNFGEMSDAIDDLTSSQVLFVTSAGNDGVNIDNYDNRQFPAGFSLSPNVISVVNTDRNDNLATSSNYGKLFTDIAAPGEGILSTLPFNVDSTGYGTWYGTSMSSPHVAGAAALLLSRVHDLDGSFDLTASELKQVLMSTVDPVASLSGKVQSGGRLNVSRALDALQPKQRVTLTIDRVKEKYHHELDSGFLGQGESPADFYANVEIDGNQFPDTAHDAYENQEDITPNWRFIQDITHPENGYADMTITIWDADGGFNGPRDIADINPAKGIEHLKLRYNYATGEVSDLDTQAVYSPDSNGQFHLGGGLENHRTEIWFTLEHSASLNIQSA